MKHLYSLLLAMLLGFGAFAAHAAGRVTLATGTVTVERAGSQTVLRRGDRVREGDILHTGSASLLQLRMDDGAVIALRPRTDFVLEAYVARAEAQRPQRALLRLLKGGLRTISGLVGRLNRDEYQLATPVATIGIRGTDYSVLFCQGDCATARDGLHAKVSAGAILARTLGGKEILLGDDEVGYISDANGTPQKQDEAPDELSIEMPPPGDDAQAGETRDVPLPALAEGTDRPDEIETRGPFALEDGIPEPEDRLRPGESRPQPSAFVTPGGAGGSGDASIVGAENSTQIAPDGSLVAFVASDGGYAIGSASTLDLGFDPDSGLRWGRWSGGSAVRSGQPLPLDDSSLHWIYGPVLDNAAALPRSGSASYTLVGNTNPTDNLGNVGFLGSAQLGANFTDQTVTSTLNLGIANQVWQANGSGTLTPNSVLFGGSYGSVTVDGAGGGNGSFSGFFVPGAAGALPEGAGLSYSLNGGGRNVSGAAVFGNPVAGGNTP